MGEGIHIEGEADIFLGGIEDRLATGHAGVVDEDGWVADLGSDFFGYCGDIAGRANVAFEIMDIACC